MPDPRDGQCGKMPTIAREGGWAQLELTDALTLEEFVLRCLSASPFTKPFVDFVIPAGCQLL